VYGPLYELFQVDDRYKAAVEVIGAGRYILFKNSFLRFWFSITILLLHSLFHVVVDTDETASRLLELLNRDRLGRVTFMPLNRLKPKEQQYPSGNDAVPMIKKLQFDAMYLKAFQQVYFVCTYFFFIY
jgi:structural maintenance of chromosome 3 (chondroitin sulfate proteoglycan 6)